MTRTPDILVIGGGIVGLLCAREFVLAGYNTTLIEKQKIGQEASWAGGGILMPLYPWQQPDAIIPLWRESLVLYRHLTLDLKNTTGIDPELHRCGMIILDDLSVDALSWCKKNAIEARHPDPAEEMTLLPRTGFVKQPAWWFPETAQIRNPRLLAALQIDLRNKGVTLLEDTEALHFSLKNNRIHQVKTHQNVFSAGEIIIAAGAWSKLLVGELPPLPKITPVKGQMLLYKTKPGLLKPIVAYNDRYLIPRRDGWLLIGSTLEYSGYDKQTTRAARHQLESFAHRILPSLSSYSLIRHWAGLRPGSPSGIPYIGRHPGIENLSFNCGHFRNGLGMAPASARLLTDLIANRKPSIPPQPYALQLKG